MSHFIAPISIYIFELPTVQILVYINYCHYTDISTLGPSDRTLNWTRCHGTPLYLTSLTRLFCDPFSGFVAGFPCGVWCHRLTNFPLHVGAIFCQSTPVLNVFVISPAKSSLSWLSVSCTSISHSHDRCFFWLHDHVFNKHQWNETKIRGAHIIFLSQCFSSCNYRIQLDSIISLRWDLHRLCFP